ncbi:MAG: hypothetical protein ABI690_10510 [Chloroflexota bacterium]
MNTIRKIALSIGILVLLAALAIPTFAADTTKTVTITETQINDSYWVTNPSWRAVSDRSVDLQAGQVIVIETITPRKGDAVTVSITYTVAVTNGRIVWTADAVTSNGEPVSQELLDQINAHMSSSWVHYMKTHRGSGRVTAIDISDDAITLTLTSKR